MGRFELNYNVLKRISDSGHFDLNVWPTDPENDKGLFLSNGIHSVLVIYLPTDRQTHICKTSFALFFEGIFEASFECTAIQI